MLGLECKKSIFWALCSVLWRAVSHRNTADSLESSYVTSSVIFYHFVLYFHVDSVQLPSRIYC